MENDIPQKFVDDEISNYKQLGLFASNKEWEEAREEWHKKLYDLLKEIKINGT